MLLRIARGSSRHLNIIPASNLQNEEHGYERTLAAVDESLQTFGFDYLNFMLNHSATSDKDTRLATWKALIEAKATGKVRAIGVSN